MVQALGALLCALAWAGAAAAAENEAEWPQAIEDNSFLVEEAYNQDPGYVQFFGQAQRIRPGGFWATSFSNEWPVPGKTHQLAYSIPYATAGDRTGGGFGDANVYYRYQALAGGERGWWFAPRLTVYFPTGDWRAGLGQGACGVQVGAPFSRRLSPWLTVHLNAGATLFPRARALDGQGREFRVSAWGLYQGASAIWLATTRLNFLFEVVASQNHQPAAPHETTRTNLALFSPGVRYAFNFPRAQIVIGAAVPAGLNRSSPDPGVLLYFAWEPQLWKPKS